MLNYHLQDPQLPAEACVIWMHGLGADASDMAGLAAYPALAALPLRHVFIDAPHRSITINAGMKMRAWYDILDFSLTGREDRQGITQSQSQLLEIIQSQLEAGFKANQIILAGFSQGGAMALYTGLHSTMLLGGIISLSSYLPIAMECQSVLQKNTPIFFGCGQFDPIVLPEWTKKSQQWLIANGYHQITFREYPMEHSICAKEVEDIGSWLSTHFIGV